MRENTIVVFSSDHGATFEKLAEGTSVYHDSNRPFRGQKRTLWEGGMRVPGVVRWPNQVPAGTESHEVIHNCDIFPTLLAAAGTAPDESLKIDGKNVLDVWLGKAKSPNRTLFWEWRESGDIQYAAMRGNLKLVISGGNKPELFDVEADPAERINLHAEFPDQLKQMKQDLDQWLSTESAAAKEKKVTKRAAQAAEKPDAD